jgi:hypothetical protein
MPMKLGLTAMVAAAVLSLAGCAGNSCKPQPVALLDTAFPHSEMPIVHSTMNGTEVDTLIDTGAQYSTVSPHTANRLNLPVAADKSVMFGGVGGTMFTSVATVHRYQLGASQGRKILLPVLGLSHHKLPDGHELGGIIGNDILRYYDIDMDLPAQQVFLINTMGCSTVVPWGGPLHPIPFGLAGDGAPIVPLTLDGRKISAIVDTGAGVSTMPDYLFRASGFAAEHLPLVGHIHLVGIGSEAFTATLYRFHRLTIGGVTWQHPVIAVGGVFPGNFAEHLFLGDNFTAHHELYISNATHELFVR